MGCSKVGFFFFFFFFTSLTPLWDMKTLEQPKVSTTCDIYQHWLGMYCPPRHRVRSRPVSHLPVDAPVCPECRALELTFCDPSCPGCRRELLGARGAEGGDGDRGGDGGGDGVAAVFAALRQWIPQVTTWERKKKKDQSRSCPSCSCCCCCRGC